MVDELRGRPLLAGVRGRPPADIAALRDALVGLATLAEAASRPAARARHQSAARAGRRARRRRRGLAHRARLTIRAQGDRDAVRDDPLREGRPGRHHHPEPAADPQRHQPPDDRRAARRARRGRGRRGRPRHHPDRGRARVLGRLRHRPAPRRQVLPGPDRHGGRRLPQALVDQRQRLDAGGCSTSGTCPSPSSPPCTAGSWAGDSGTRWPAT